MERAGPFDDESRWYSRVAPASRAEPHDCDPSGIWTKSRLVTFWLLFAMGVAGRSERGRGALHGHGADLLGQPVVGQEAGDAAQPGQRRLKDVGVRLGRDRSGGEEDLKRGEGGTDVVGQPRGGALQSVRRFGPPRLAEPGCCVLFVDGLLYDLGRLLAESLEATGYTVSVRSRWAALPTVTGTAKPAVSPVAGAIAGRALEAMFVPRFESTGKLVDAAGLRSAIAAQGGQVLEGDEFPIPSRPDAAGWREAGELDTLGHKLGARLAAMARVQVSLIGDEVLSLLESGWQQVRVVTDHGWLLLPEGLPKVELPTHLAATKWSRCAVLEGAAPDGIVVVPWHWNPQHSVATAPGIACFTANQEYAHGGVSLQECLIPEILVTRVRAAAGGAIPRLVSVAWARYRCVVETRDAFDDLRVDIRVDTLGGPSTLQAPKALDADGSVSIPVEDEYEGRQLARIIHERSATTSDLPASTASRWPGLLDILHEYAYVGRAARSLYLQASPLSRDELHEQCGLVVLLLDLRGTVIAQRKTRIGDKS
jgi:hypothetical protein